METELQKTNELLMTIKWEMEQLELSLEQKKQQYQSILNYSLSLESTKFTKEEKQNGKNN